jgi:hypothetical protein
LLDFGYGYLIFFKEGKDKMTTAPNRLAKIAATLGWIVVYLTLYLSPIPILALVMDALWRPY